MIPFLDTLASYSDQLVNYITFGLLESMHSMYLSWLNGNYYEPNVVGYVFGGLYVVLKFLIPIIIFNFLVSSLTKNLYIRIIITAVFTVAYAFLWFNPISEFEHASASVTNFYYFLQDLPSITTEPFIFTFLTNGAVVFALQFIGAYICLYVFFALIGFAISALFWFVTYGKSIWSISEKSFKIYIAQLVLVFLFFYALSDSLHAFTAVAAFVIGSANIKEAIYTLRGYEKYCYNQGGEVICRWVK